MNVNKLVLSTAGNDAIREKLATVKPGDSVEIELTVQLDEMTADQASFSVLEADVMEETPVIPETGEEGSDEMGNEPTEEDGSAVMEVLAGTKSKS
jgi:hypothetical protein